MSKIKKSNAAEYKDLFSKATATTQTKKAFKQFQKGKTTVFIEQTYGDSLEDGTDFYVAHLLIQKGSDEGRTIKRKFYMPKDPKNPTEREIDNINKYKAEFDLLGVADQPSVEAALEALEECFVEVDIWIPSKPNQYGYTNAVPYFKRFISGPGSEEKEEKEEEVEEVKPKAKKQPKIDKEPAKGTEENPEVVSANLDDIEY